MALEAGNIRKSFQEDKKGQNPSSSEMDPAISTEKTSANISAPDYVRVILVTDVTGRKRKLYIPAALDLDRPKRPRISFSQEQLKVLELEFEENHFVSETRRQTLARALDLTETQIKVWFQNRRTKFRRQDQSPSPSPLSIPSRTSTVQSALATPPFSFPVHHYKYPGQFQTFLPPLEMQLQVDCVRHL